MTARIYKNFEFLAAVHFENEFYTNLYEVDVYFNVEADSIKEQNVALERIKFFLNECLQHSVIVDQNDTDAIEKFTEAGMRVCTLPEEPYDQIIGIMLYVKLNKIVEGRLVITDINVTSSMSDGVSCCYSEDENIGPFTSKGWWSNVSPKINDITTSNKNKKILKIAKNKITWDDLFLGWQTKDLVIVEKQTDSQSTSEVVYAKFPTVEK